MLIGRAVGRALPSSIPRAHPGQHRQATPDQEAWGFLNLRLAFPIFFFPLWGVYIRTVLFQPPGTFRLISRAMVGSLKHKHLRSKSRGSCRGENKPAHPPGESRAVGAAKLSAPRAQSGRLLNSFAGARLRLLQAQHRWPRGRFELGQEGWVADSVV